MRQGKAETGAKRCDYGHRVDRWQSTPSPTALNRLFLHHIWILHLLIPQPWLHWIEYNVSTGLYERVKSWDIKKMHDTQDTDLGAVCQGDQAVVGDKWMAQATPPGPKSVQRLWGETGKRSLTSSSYTWGVWDNIPWQAVCSLDQQISWSDYKKRKDIFHSVIYKLYLMNYWSGD